MDDHTQAEATGARYTRLVRSLPTTAPFIGPETLERANGRPFALRLGANESSFGPSPLALDAMRTALARIAWYGDPEAYAIRHAIADHLGVDADHIGIGAGIDDLLGQFVRLYLEPGDSVVTSLGSYPTFGFHVAGFGGHLEQPSYRDDRNDLAALTEAAHRTNARLIYLVNPDNPTGSWYTGAEIMAFFESLPKTSMLMLDEAYIEFAPAEAITHFAADNPRVVRLRTFSKAYGMAGARIGYVIANPNTIRALDRIRLHFGVNAIAHAGAQAAIADHTYLAAIVAEVCRGREEYAALAREMGLTALPSATNFVAIDVGGARRAQATVTALASEGVFIRLPGAPPLDRCIRVTVGDADERAAFARIFREVWPRIDAS